MAGIQRLLIVSHVVHYYHNGQLYAYGPYVREIDIWADLFSEVIIASPCQTAVPPADCIPFTRPNIAMAPQLETGGVTLTAKLKQLFLLPLMVKQLCQAMRQADAIQVRCPGNLGLLGVILAPLFSRHLIAKYAGQWNGYQGEPFTVALQRKLLSYSWWRGPVTVYGHWPKQPNHVISFFTSMMTAEEVEHAAHLAASRSIHTPLRILYSGVLTQRKRVSALLDALKLAVDNGLEIEVAIVGGGPESNNLVQQATRLGISDKVTFVGALAFKQALEWYEWADCLVLPSQHSEGWPKVVAEAMCYGLICIAVDHGQVSEMLRGRGILLKKGDPCKIYEAIASITSQHEQVSQVMLEASSWARQYSLEGLRAALARLLAKQWGHSFSGISGNCVGQSNLFHHEGITTTK
jgi:glycosyltransferase involved in cell wall biosynthesis